MSETTASRPRPRPKPRARAPSAAPSSPGPSGSHTLPPPPTAPTVINVDDDDDDDALFIRRKAPQWSRRPKVVPEKVKRKTSKAPVSESSDVEIQRSPPRRPQPNKKGSKKGGLPDWTKSSNGDFIDIDDEDDDLIERRLATADATPKKTSAKRSRPEQESSSSNKRQRSRSRSLTPPPELPRHILQNAVERVRDIIHVEPMAMSTKYLMEEPTTTFELDPELASIALQVKAGQYAHTPAGSRGTTPALDGGPEIVTIRVKWKAHPLNEAARPQQWDFKMKRHDAFKNLFEETADEAAILSDNLIVTHDGTRVFPSASPHGIGVWAQTELEACDKATYEYIRAHQRRSPSVGPDSLPTTRGFTASLPATQEETEEDDDDEEEEAVEDKGDKFKIILRSKAAKDITLTVRPTTKCGAIVKAFLKSAGLTDKYPGAGEVAGKTPAKKGRKNAAPAGGPWLAVDGDKMANNVEIGEADLEDGDMVEVTGL